MKEDDSHLARPAALDIFEQENQCVVCSAFSTPDKWRMTCSLAGPIFRASGRSGTSAQGTRVRLDDRGQKSLSRERVCFPPASIHPHGSMCAFPLVLHNAGTARNSFSSRPGCSRRHPRPLPAPSWAILFPWPAGPLQFLFRGSPVQPRTSAAMRWALQAARRQQVSHFSIVIGMEA